MTVLSFLQFNAIVWLGIDGSLITSSGLALGSVLASAAALYAAFVGLRTYKDSVMTSRARTLFEAEGAFTKIMPMLMLIENPDRYTEKVGPLIGKVFSVPHQRLDDDEFHLLHDLDNAIRFFYVFHLYEQLNIKHQGIINAYIYYWKKMTDDDHKELRNYIQKYYPTLWQHFQQAAD